MYGFSFLLRWQEQIAKLSKPSISDTNYQQQISIYITEAIATSLKTVYISYLAETWGVHLDMTWMLEVGWEGAVRETPAASPPQQRNSYQSLQKKVEKSYKYGHRCRAIGIHYSVGSLHTETIRDAKHLNNRRNFLPNPHLWKNEFSHGELSFNLECHTKNLD